MYRSLVLLALLGCHRAPPACDEATCLASCPSAPGSVMYARVPHGEPGQYNVLTDAEYAVLEPTLADLRAGVRPWDEDAVGLCAGVGGCVRPIGRDGGVLPPGDYVVSARLRAPRLGTGAHWKVVYRQACRRFVLRDGKRAEVEGTQAEETHEVQFVSETEPYTLPAVATIRSPDPDATQTCAWRLELHNPLRVDRIEGTWQVPTAADLEEAARAAAIAADEARAADEGAPPEAPPPEPTPAP